MTPILSTHLVIFVGSRCAGRMRHLARLLHDAPERYAPLKTLTTRTEPKEGDESWFVRVPRADLLTRLTIDEILTYYVEGDHRYFVVLDRLVAAQLKRKTPIIGMTPLGLERLMTRQRINPVPFTAFFLQPENLNEFRRTLMREYGLQEDAAEVEVDRAVRLSTIPPARSTFGTSIIPVPVTGTDEDDKRIDAALRAILPP